MSANQHTLKSTQGWVYHQRGLLSDTLRQTSIELPTLQPGEVLLKLHAAALNPVDWKLAALIPTPLLRLANGGTGITAGADFAGEVVALAPPAPTDAQGSRSSSIDVGTRVYGKIPLGQKARYGRGSLARHLVVTADALAVIPDGMDYQQAAGLALVGITAVGMIQQLEHGQRVLVYGAGSAVGLVVTQMCKHLGATVVAVASGAKADLLGERGADEVIDYTKLDTNSHLKTTYGTQPFDWVLDCIGSVSTYHASPAFLRSTGTYLNVGASDMDPNALLSSILNKVKDAIAIKLLPTWLGGTPRKYVNSIADSAAMDQLQTMVREGVVTPLVDTVYEFDRVPEAYTKLLQGKTTGKLIVSLAE